jgi:hypothetical protein
MAIEDLVEKEEGFERAKKKQQRGAILSPIIATLYPREEGKIFENRFLIFAFNPGHFGIFNRILSPDLEVLNLGLKVHFVSVEAEDSGEIENKMVLCPVLTNEKFKSLYGNMVLGDFADECPLCKHAEEWWAKYNERREQTGIKGLPSEEYRAAVQRDVLLVQFRQKARQFSAISRYMFVVFDLDKYEGRKPLAEGEYCGYQILLVPETVFMSIAGFVRTFVRSGIRFWEIDNLHAVSIVRDTREGFPGVRYTVSIDPRPYQVNKELRDYLLRREIPDPSNLINLWTELFVQQAITMSGLAGDNAGVQKQGAVTLTPGIRTGSSAVVGSDTVSGVSPGAQVGQPLGDVSKKGEVGGEGVKMGVGRLRPPAGPNPVPPAGPNPVPPVASADVGSDTLKGMDISGISGAEVLESVGGEKQVGTTLEGGEAKDKEKGLGTPLRRKIKFGK